MAIWSPNRFEWVVTQYATARVGAILVNINPAYKALELKHALNQSGTRLLLLSKWFRLTDYRAVLDEARRRCPSLEHVFVLEDDRQRLLSDGASFLDGDAGSPTGSRSSRSMTD